MEGLCIANGRSPWFLMNAASLGKPVSSQAELAARANEAMAYFANEQHPWFFIGSEEWLGNGSSETLSRLGLTKAFSVTGMVAEQLAPLSRPLPEVETRRIDDESGRLALSDLNAVAYGLPPDWVRGVVAGAAAVANATLRLQCVGRRSSRGDRLRRTIERRPLRRPRGHGRRLSPPRPGRTRHASLCGGGDRANGHHTNRPPCHCRRLSFVRQDGLPTG